MLRVWATLIALYVLEENFPEVPLDRRRAYAETSGGYVRAAADLCRDDANIALALDCSCCLDARSFCFFFCILYTLIQSKSMYVELDISLYNF